MKIAVVILNWNGKSYLEKFLPAVISCSSSARIIVADNGSTDDSVSFLKDKFPKIELIELDSNHGFAGGYNKSLGQIFQASLEAGKERIYTDYYILLNSDVEVTPHWIEPVIRLMEKDQTIAAVQPKIKSYLEKSKFEYAGAAGGFIDKFGYPFCRGRIFDSIETDSGQYDDETEIFWATGACLFIRAGLFHNAGGFDDDFFAHMEEIDLCWRLKNRGYRIFYCPDSTVYHMGGGTLHKSNPQKTFLNFRNNLWLLEKNLPFWKLFPVISIRFILDGVAGLKFLFEGNVKDFFAVIKAHFSIYSSLGSTFKKREKKLRINHTCIYRKSIIWEFFVRDRKIFSSLK